MQNSLKQLVQGKGLLFIIVLGLGGSFQTGCHITIISSASPFIKQFINNSWTLSHGRAPEEDTLTLLWATFVSIQPAGALFGSFCVQFVLHHLGRNKAMSWCNTLNFLAVAIMLMSKPANSFVLMTLARFLFGLNIGLVGNIHSIYLGESVPKKIRGSVSVTVATFLATGKMAGNIAGLSELLGQEDFWHILLCVPALFTFLQMITLPFLPEAPKYLLIDKGKIEECREALQYLWGPGDYKLDIEEMQLEQEFLKGQCNKSILDLLRNPDFRWQCCTLVIISTALQYCGIAAIGLFAYNMLEEAGIPTDKIRYVTLGISASEIFTSISCSLLIDRVGRRVLLWAGFGMMAVIQALLTTTLQLKEYDFWVPYISICLMFLFIFFYGGPAGVIMPLNYEIFVHAYQPAVFKLMGSIIWANYTAFGFIFPFILNALRSFIFLAFSCVCLTTSLYMFFILPETKGKTILEIREDFKKIRVCGSAAEDKCLETKL